MALNALFLLEAVVLNETEQEKLGTNVSLFSHTLYCKSPIYTNKLKCSHLAFYQQLSAGQPIMTIVVVTRKICIVTIGNPCPLNWLYSEIS